MGKTWNDTSTSFGNSPGSAGLAHETGDGDPWGHEPGPDQHLKLGSSSCAGSGTVKPDVVDYQRCATVELKEWRAGGAKMIQDPIRATCEELLGYSCTAHSVSVFLSSFSFLLWCCAGAVRMEGERVRGIWENRAVMGYPLH